MKKIANKFLNIGVHEGLSKGETKLVILLNFFCIIWYATSLTFTVTDYFFLEQYVQLLSGYAVEVGYAVEICLLILVQILQANRKYTIARLLFIFSTYFQFFVFSNFIVPENLDELFYILTPLFSLIFFNDRRVHYTFLFLALISFIVPVNFFNIYAEGVFKDPAVVPIIFIGVFLLVNYFKNLNAKNEALLNEQKDNAIEHTVLIEKQKHSLETLHDFEIRTPLTIMKGNINRIKKSGTPENIEHIMQLESQTQNIQRIINDVMDLTKMDSNNFQLKTENVLLSALVNRVFTSFYSNFQNKNIAYTLIDNSNKKSIVDADVTYLESALSNIITNAFKYTNEPGEVSLLLEQDGQNNTLIKIQDSGIGIAKNDIENVFNRFYQVNNSINRSGGSGIGLAFTKEIIEKHKGKIVAESSINEGSCFTISLPIKSFAKKAFKDIGIHIPKTTEVTLPHTIDKKTILLVEDHQEMREYIKSILTQYNTLEASNGIEALISLEKNKVDYIITDYMMPQMDGLQFIKELNNKGNRLPVLMLTARTDFETKINTLRLGIDDYITKPFDEEELLLRINHGLTNYSSQQKFIEKEDIPLSETKDVQFTKDLQTYIEDNCANSTVNILELCEEFSMSQSSLYRKVKAITGFNTKEFIAEVKLQKARELRRKKTDITLKDLVLSLGYKNSTHFVNLYEKRFGEKPK